MEPWGGRYCGLTLPPPHARSRHPHRSASHLQLSPCCDASLYRWPTLPLASLPPSPLSYCPLQTVGRGGRRPLFFISPLPPWRRRLSFPPLSRPLSVRKGKLAENAVGFTSFPPSPFHAWRDVVAWPPTGSDADEGDVWLYLPNTYGRRWRRTHISFDRSVAESSSSQIFYSSVSYGS